MYIMRQACNALLYNNILLVHNRQITSRQKGIVMLGLIIIALFLESCKKSKY